MSRRFAGAVLICAIALIMVPYAANAQYAVSFQGQFAGIGSCFGNPDHGAHVGGTAIFRGTGGSSVYYTQPISNTSESYVGYSFSVYVPDGVYLETVRLTAASTSNCYTFSGQWEGGPYEYAQAVTGGTFTATQKIFERTFIVKDQNGNGVEGATITAYPQFNSLLNPSPIQTDANGHATATVCCGFLANLTVSKPCFVVGSKQLGPVAGTGTTQFNGAGSAARTITGVVRQHSNGAGLAGVTLSGFNGSVITQSDGTYTGHIDCGTSATVAPSLVNGAGVWGFAPAEKPIAAVSNEQNAKYNLTQDFTAFPPDAWVQVLAPNSAEYHQSGQQITLSWMTNYSNTSTNLYLVEDTPDNQSSWRTIYDIKNGQNRTATIPFGTKFKGQMLWTIPPSGWSPVYGQGSYGLVDKHLILASSYHPGSGTSADMSDQYFTVYWVGKSQGDDEPDPTEGLTATIQDDRFDAPNFVGFAMAGPNPTRESVSFSIGLEREDAVEVNVFDIAGRPVRILQKQTMPAGKHALTWDGRGDDGQQVPPGIYLVNARSGAWQKSIKLIRTK
jgi:hypothetical protein